jgi:EAL domain-containing protein (putative c-di-GMP-specific phosphodiesterase class I)
MSVSTHILKFSQGQQVFKVGDHAHCAYIVESGSIGLYPNTNKDDRIALISKGELLGEMGVINDTVRAISAYAETDLELMVIDREQITTRLQKSDPIIRGVMEVLLSRIRNMLNEGRFEDAKDVPENTIVTEGMHKIRFEKELFQAFENDEIINVYQPIVDLKDGHIAGFEALSRWQHPEKGMVSPFEFISLAEESDFIITLGVKIFSSACEHLAQFQKLRDKHASHLPPLFMSINVSAAQLTSKNFLLTIKQITEKYQISPANIKIEITESLVVDFENVAQWMDDCQKQGFRLSLDDFGTGYSGFQSLLELNFQTIKIDQIFIKSMGVNPKSLIMLEVITNMAKRLKMSIVAEGIEDLNSSIKLAEIGVDYGQGYYFFKPMNRKKILETLQ